jgi:rod shape determining protein RodA
MTWKHRLLLSFDWLWFFCLLGLSAAGLLAIWSTTEGTSLDTYFGRQLIYLCLALVVFAILLYFDYHIYSDYIALIYICGMTALGLVLAMGQTIHSSKSWISVGGMFAAQPSELMKVVVILALAKYYSELEHDELEIRELALGGLIVAVPVIMVMLQGDLGTAVTFLPIYVTLSFLAGLKKKHVVVIVVACAIAAPVSWMMLKDYQKGRIQTVFNPSNDPRNLGYQTIQSKIAIGSGKFLGKGFKQGTQGQLGFLPARHTDFVFAVWSEERGFIGSLGMLGVFLILAVRLIMAAREAKDKVGTMTVAGVLALYLFHLFINVGMVVGLLPIAGIPLPFVSAGGSSLISFYAAMSICMNINMRRYVN